MSIEAVLTQAREGRGLWAGLFPEELVLEGHAPSEDDKWPHVTLAHFGRRVDPKVAAGVAAACQATTAIGRGTVVAKSWGRARIDQSAGSVIALLLEGRGMDVVRAELLEHCVNAGVRVDDRFGFHPHMTLRRLELGATAMIDRTPKLELRFTALSLVCGEARADFPFGPAPF